MKKANNKQAQKIGNVEVIFNVDPADIVYVDGAEKELLDIFSSSNPKQKTKKLLASNPPWALYYHLSKKRGAIIDWYDFKKGSTVLEVGAGCGAITESLVSKDISVTALEVDPTRALVNAHRNKLAKNLNIVVENVENYVPEAKYDYIVCIGVLEYSGRYIDSDEPYASFVESLKKLLNPDGILLLAIENKMGLKYLAGAPEDHTNIIFDSINNYPSSAGIKTFSKNELSLLLTGSGFQSINYYFPHPDYKMPHAIFSEDMFPGKNIETPLGLFPSAAYQERRYLFSEQAFMMGIETEQAYPFFSNSYFVEASADTIDRQGSASYFTQVDRKPEFAISTTIFRKPQSNHFYVRKKAITSISNAHIKYMEDNGKVLSLNKKLSKYLTVSEVNNSDISGTPVTQWIEYDMVKGLSLERKLLDAVLNLDNVSASEIINRIIKIVNSLETKKLNPTKQPGYSKVFGNSYDYESMCVLPGLIDLNLDNIIDENGTWNLIDYEWVFDFYVPRDYLISRILLIFFRNKFSDILRRHHEAIELLEPVSDMIIPKYIYEIVDIKNANLQECYKAECSFQSYVYGRTIKPDKTIVFHNNPQPVTTHQSFTSYVSSLEQNNNAISLTLGEQNDLINIQQAEIEKLRLQLNDPAVKGYKKARSLARKVIKRRK